MQPDITPHELRILLTYARLGHTRNAAKALGLAEQTVKNELGNVRRKLGVKSSIQAVYRVTAHMKLDEMLQRDEAA